MEPANNNIESQEQVDKLLKGHGFFYDRLDYEKVFTDKKEVIRHFIESEDFAKKYVVQGEFYPMAHYELTKIIKTKMNGIDAEIIITTFYHLLRLGGAPNIQQNNYAYLQKAMCLLTDLYQKFTKY